MFMEMAELRSFAVLAEELHFARASRRLFMSQPALSKQIRRMEDKVGGSLFSRTRRRVELTEAGRVLLLHARKVIHEGERAFAITKQALEGRAGTLRIGFGMASVSDALPRLIVGYRKACPLVELHLRNMHTLTQISALLEGAIDVGILRLPIAHKELDALPLMRDRIMAVTHRSVRYDPRQGLGCLRASPFVLFDRSVSELFHDTSVALCRSADFTPNVVQQASETLTILNLVRAQVGVSLVLGAAMRMRVREIKFHELRTQEAEWPIGVAWNRFSEKRDLISRFVATARSTLRTGAKSNY